MNGWLAFSSLGLTFLLGCECAPPPPRTYLEIDHHVHVNGHQGFAEVRIVPSLPGRDGVAAALREAHHRYWLASPAGTRGRAITEFHAWAFASREACQRGEAPIGRCERTEEAVPLSVQVVLP